MDKTNVKYLDIMKGICIIMIINVHLPKDMRPFSILFHVTGFFLVSGILLFKSNLNISFKEFFIKKIKSLGYPYILISLIYLFIYLNFHVL